MSAIGTTAGRATLRRIVGRGAIARPRRALAATLAILLVAAGALLAITRPWQGGSSDSAQAAAQGVTQHLTRNLVGPGGTDMSIVWATPQYLKLTGQADAISRFAADRNDVFLVMESVHTDDLPSMKPLVLRQGGMDMEATRVVTSASSAHHRLSVLVFPRMGATGEHAAHAEAPVQMVVPPVHPGGAQRVLSWNPALGAVPASAPAATLHLTWGTMLALFGGLLSSMWPCLFQLSVYFVPTLAGVSAAGGEEAAPRGAVRGRLLKTAGAFVLGFIVVYTAAGAAAGAAAGSLGGTSIFWGLRRELTLGAGVVLLLMALRLAANGHSPIVCKMPLGNFLRRKKVGPLGTAVLGACFAIGCTTCFGAAIVLGLITYVGMSGTALTGALIMLVFALGMAIPLMIGSLLMARVMTYFSRMEKVAPYMVLGAAAVMAGFAVLLISGHYMVFSNLVAAQNL